MIALLVLVGCFGPRELEGVRLDRSRSCYIHDTLVVDNWYWWSFDRPCTELSFVVPLADGTCWELIEDCQHGPIEDPAVDWETAAVCANELRDAPSCDDLWWMNDTADTADTGDSGDTAGG